MLTASTLKLNKRAKILEQKSTENMVVGFLGGMGGILAGFILFSFNAAY